MIDEAGERLHQFGLSVSFNAGDAHNLSFTNLKGDGINWLSAIT